MKSPNFSFVEKDPQIMKDLYGNEVTTSSIELIEGINIFTKTLLQYRPLENIENHLISDQYCSLGFLYLSVVNLFQGKKNEAKKYLDQSEKLLENANEREKLTFDFVNFWNNGDLTQSIKVHRKIAQLYPKDVISTFICYQHYIFLGDMKGILELVEIILPFHKDDPYIYSMHCFALEENQRFKEAEEYGILASKLAKEQINPWSHHSVCHVYDTTAELDKGIKWMEENCHQWSECNNFMQSHNWWHLSLLYLEKGEKEADNKVHEIFETHLWKKEEKWRKDPSVLVGIIGLLWRMELKGQKLYVDWDEIVDYVKPYYKLKIWNFFDIHFIYSLARKSDFERVEEMLDVLKVSPLVHDVAKSISLYGMNQVEKSLEYLPDYEKIWNLGGSNAQRAVFDLSFINILHKNNQFHQSKQIIQDHIYPMQDRFSYTIRKLEYENLKGQMENSVYNKWLKIHK